MGSVAFPMVNSATIDYHVPPTFDDSLHASDISMFASEIDSAGAWDAMHHHHMPIASTSSAHPSLRGQPQSVSSSNSTSPTHYSPPCFSPIPTAAPTIDISAQQKEWIASIRSSPWFRNNQSEPEDSPGQSIFLRFLGRASESGTYVCLFRGCGKVCNRTFDRRDRALGHVRQHLNHRPFWCGGRCFNANWYVANLLGIPNDEDIDYPA
jgi:hypothetical protein